MNVRAVALCLCAGILVSFVSPSAFGELPHRAASQKYGASQKDVKQKGGPAPPPKPHHHWWCGPPPPMGPILEPAAVLRVAGPIRNTRLRLSQNVDTNPEAGEEKPEAGVENNPANVQALAESVASLDKRVDDLYMTLKLLVDRLGAEE